MKSNGMPDETQAGKALDYLHDSEHEYAVAYARKEAMEQALKIAKDTGFLASEGTVAERQAMAGTSKEYVQAVENLESAYVDLELIKAKRQRAVLTIECWRTIEASRRRS
jgi:purine-nucleoside phosphorylase